METLNTNHRENAFLDAAQVRIYRRTLGLAPPYVAQQKGLEYIKKNELLRLTALEQMTSIKQYDIYFKYVYSVCIVV